MQDTAPLSQPDNAPVAEAGYDLVARALLACEVERLSGVLRVTGEPGGLIHLTDGNVTAIETAGAPGPDLILVRSGRIPEASWAGAFTSAAAGGRMASELIERGLIGEGELEAVLRISLADAMFAVAGGRVDETAVEHATTPSLLPLEQPAAPGWLLFERPGGCRCSPGPPTWYGTIGTGSPPTRPRRRPGAESCHQGRTRSSRWPMAAVPPGTWPSSWAAASTL